MVKCPAGPHRPDGIGNICRTWLAAGPVLLSVDDEFEDSLFDVLTQTGPINDVPRTPWSFQFVADEQTDVLTAVSQYQVLSFTLTQTHTHTHTHTQTHVVISRLWSVCQTCRQRDINSQSHKKLSCRRQTARRTCAICDGVADL